VTIAVVTGGSRGIGRSLVEILCANGIKVLAIATNATLLEDLALSTGCEVLAVDLKEPNSVGKIVDFVLERFGSAPDLVICNAVDPSLRPFTELSDMDIEGSFRVNLVGPVRLTRLCLSQNERCRFIFVSSLSAAACPSGSLLYGTTKVALSRFADLAQAELDKGQILLVELGPVRTDLLAETLSEPSSGRALRWIVSSHISPVMDADEVAAHILEAHALRKRYLTLPRRLTGLSVMRRAPQRGLQMLERKK
jgi:NAD(P)-dependent dehydrogenase (short-subunit alcohol dehydrogenase family)